MSALTLLVLRVAFLLLLWLFVFAIVYALRSDLFGARVKRLPPGQSPAAPGAPGSASTGSASPASPAPGTPARQPPPGGFAASPAPRATSGKATLSSASRLVITSGPKAGRELALTAQPLTIGRSAESGLVIRDDYTSTHHARLLTWNDEWMLQDLDSTNGTFLGGRRVSVPTQVPLDTPIKVGTTTFELRR